MSPLCAAQVMVDAIAEVDRLAGAARQHRAVLNGPGGAEQHGGPEQVARKCEIIQ
jgi:hypothetical protein